jgi:hypothetical protein
MRDRKRIRAPAKPSNFALWTANSGVELLHCKRMSVFLSLEFSVLTYLFSTIATQIT